MSSVTGEQVQLSIFGESHGPAIGCVIDGLPAGIPVNLDAIYKDMARRVTKPPPPGWKRIFPIFSPVC